MKNWSVFALSGLLLAGCAKPRNVSELRPAIEPYLDALRAARAQGEFAFNTGGSPLSAGQKLTFFIGPENLTISFRGTVDFTDGQNVQRKSVDSEEQ